MRHLSKEGIRPAVAGKAGLKSRHPLDRSMHSDMHHGMCLELTAYPAVESDILVMRRIFLVEQKSHGITLHADTGLNAYKDIAESYAADKNILISNRHNFSRKFLPAIFDAFTLP